MDSTNAIILDAPETPGAPYTYEDYGVKPAHCVPDEIPPFEYAGLKAFGLDGRPAPPSSAEELRKAAELYHRIKLEL